MHHVDAHRLANGEWLAAVDGCGHAPYTTSRSSLHLLAAMQNGGNTADESITRARGANKRAFTTASVPPSVIMDASDDTNDGKGGVVSSSTPPVPLSYSMSSGHVPLAVRQDGAVVIVAVTQPQFFALTYLLDTLRSAQAQVVVYDMGMFASHIHHCHYSTDHPIVRSSLPMSFALLLIGCLRRIIG